MGEIKRWKLGVDIDAILKADEAKKGLDELEKDRKVKITAELTAPKAKQELTNIKKEIKQIGTELEKAYHSNNSSLIEELEDESKALKRRKSYLESFIKENEKQIESAKALETIDKNRQKIIEGAAKATEETTKVTVDGAKKQVEAQNNVAKAIALTEKEIAKATERYNKWMSRAGYDHRTVGLGEDDGYTKGWNLRDMVAEAESTIASIYDIGKGNSTLTASRSERAGLQGFIDAYKEQVKDMQTTVNHLDSSFNNTPVLKESIKLTEQLTQKEKEHTASVEAATKANKENAQSLEKVSQLMSDLSSKYGVGGFSEIFGETLSSFGALNASNALQVYDALIAKDEEFIAERQKVAGSLKEFAEYFEANHDLINKSDKGAETFTRLMNDISQGAITATDAIKQLNDVLEKNKNLGYHAGDLGKAESYGAQGGSRSTGHFGTGTYFVGDPKRIEGYNSRDGIEAPVEVVDFSKYNLFKPATSRQALELHDVLHDINGELSRMHAYDDLDLNFFKRAAEDDNFEAIKGFADKYLSEYVYSQYENKADKYLRYLENSNAESIRESIINTEKEVVEMLGLGDEFLKSSDEIEKEVQKRLADNKEALANFNLESFILEHISDDLNYGKFDDNISHIKSIKDNLINKLSNIFVDKTRSELSDLLEQTFTTISNYQGKDFYKLDSASTVFMKQLGYEGVDTRHTDLDNTRYGSVIYDLKGEDLTRRQAILHEREHKKAIDAKTKSLEKEIKSAKDAAITTDKLNSEIAENNKLLSESPTIVGISQPTTPKGITIDRLDEYQSSFNEQEMKSILKGIDIDRIAKTFSIVGEERQELAVELEKLASMTAELATTPDGFDGDLHAQQFDKVTQMIISNGKNKKQKEKQFDKLLNYLGDTVIKYTDEDVKEFDPKEWEVLFKRFGVAKGKRQALISQDSGRSINSLWDELIKEVGPVGEIKKDTINDHQQFKEVLQTLALAYDEKANYRKNEFESLSQFNLSEVNAEIAGFLDSTYGNVVKLAEAKTKITREDKEQLDLIGKTTEKTKEQIKAAEKLAKKKEEVNNLLGIGLAEKVGIDEFVKNSVNKSIELLRNAENSGKNVISFEGVFTGEDLLDQVSDAVNVITKQLNFEVGSFSVGKSDASFKLINQETGFAIEQTYRLKDATEEVGSATIEVTNKVSGSMITARKNLMSLLKEYNNVDLEKQKAALSGKDTSIYDREQELILTKIVNLQELVTLNEKEQIEISKIDNQLMQQKAKLIESTAQKEKQSQEEILKLTNNAMQQINSWKSDGSFGNIFSKDLQNEIKNFQSSLSNLDENSDLPNIKKQWSDVAAKAKEAIKANQEYSNSFYKNEFQNNYKYTNGKTAQDQTTFDSMRDFYKKQEQDAQNFNSNIKRIYSDLISTLQQINTLDTKINDLSLKDAGSGLYSASIQSLQAQKSGLVANMRSITDEINRTVNASANENGIAKFFDVAKQKAVLTSAEIEKFDQLLLQADRTGFEFASKITGKIQPVIEKLQSLNKAVADGVITNPDMIRGIDAMSTTLSSKFNKFKEFGDAVSAMDAMNYSDSISQNVTALDKLIQKETQYFANKQKYADGMKFDNMNTLSADVKNTTSVMDKTKSDLSALAQEFAEGKAIITGFKQSADGISTLNFSVLDTATSSMRQFSMEMGTASKQAYLTETSISQTTKTIQNAEQQVGKMQSLLNTVSASGFKISGDGTHTSVARLVNLMHELNAAAQKGEVTTIDELMKKSKIATSEVQKLYNESIKLQNSLEDGSAKYLGEYNVNSTVTDFDQLSAAVRRHAADIDGAALKVGKFDEKHNKLNYTLTHGNGNVEHYTASINTLGKSINTQSQGVTKLQSGWKQLGGIISKSAKQMTMAIMGYNVFYQVISKVRQGVTYIKEIDTAMTELKKVTDETAKSYETFVKNAAVTGSKIGATVSDYVNATADFARLGYEMNEAGKMAEVAIVYKNVADGLDTIEESTESITSTMKAFGIESSDTMGIIDSFNEVGKFIAQAV